MEALSLYGKPKVKNTFLDLTQIRLELARMQLSGPVNLSPEIYHKRIEEFTCKKESLEAELSRLSGEFALEKTAGRTDTKGIAMLLPEGAAYIDFVRMKLRDFKGKKWGTPHYLAFVLIPGNDPEVKLLDMGKAKTIDRHIRAYRKEMNRVNVSGGPPDQEILNHEASSLYRQIIEPLKPFLRGKRNLFISPDGELNLVPFEVLITSEGRYLMEKYLISYVGAGRDIIRFMDTALQGKESLIMADPDYNMGIKDKDMVVASLGVAGRTRNAVSRDASSLNFLPLPDTRKEALAVGKILKGKQRLKVNMRLGQEAVEEVLFHAEKPRILHIATHGYFLKDEEISKTDTETRGISIIGKEDFRKIPILNIENPMLRSGIVLAGANASLKEGRDDGMVSAEKILGLNLRGTDLVVLSACETGVGDVKNGEGVFGLKRAFILSGAKTLVMSLWSVPSMETTELMTAFYGLLSEGKTKAEALREAKLDMMRKHPNPYYWGAFVLNGKPN
jgi:CHAT domain-containing protein